MTIKMINGTENQCHTLQMFNPYSHAYIYYKTGHFLVYRMALKPNKVAVKADVVYWPWKSTLVSLTVKKK